ncbi:MULTISPECIES: hypothetical protein [unclassified Coleofasciculus]|uniref:hypothetical protein n=1 Tax=unclassified Coleofasciculus TaxID=2692782 RepID=UPI00188229BE|nr:MULTISPECIES: hypothetical protein [unclassified Coleofasciculus]MBE9127975.1 hypothetical protein [Coleofasciculus sp. LEGE 07081]MBE9149846.1 hypothetical protein [Coleofasciculus sp. LEGE 07092]
MDSLQAKYKSVVEQVLRDYAEFLDNDDQVQREPYSIRSDRLSLVSVTFFSC